MPQVSVTALTVRPGHNPRKRFVPAWLNELASSIKVQGVLQPLLVRPVGETLEIVAGERRWRAAQLAGLTEVPVLIREMSDQEAFFAAIAENADRSDMDPAEDAEAAAKALGMFGGDREEAAKRLGWTRQKLDKRLALMNCSDPVRQALGENRIMLGHAELLATLAKDVQDKALGNMLAAKTLPTVAELRSRVEALARSLASAPFDKTVCASCAHNSGQQRAMFSEAIAASDACTNAVCFDGKIEQALAAIADELREDYPEIRIVRAGENFTLLKVIADGATGLGVEQATACRACAKFGAAISAVPGKVGQVYRDLCFDPACYAGQVSERIKAEKQAAESAKATPAAVAGKSTATAPKAKAGDAKPGEVAQRVKDYRVKIWRDALRRELMRDEGRNTTALIAIGLAGLGRHISSSKLMSALAIVTGGKTTSSFTFVEAAEQVLALDDAGRRRMHMALAGSVASEVEEQVLKKMLLWCQCDLGQHWKVDAEFLGLLTRSEIEVLVAEIGLKELFGEKEFAKMLAGKKEESIKKLLESGFDFTGKVPKVMQYR